MTIFLNHKIWKYCRPRYGITVDTSGQGLFQVKLQDPMSKDDEFRIRRLFRDFLYCCFVTTN